MQILLADAQEVTRRGLETILKTAGYKNILEATTQKLVLQLVANKKPQLVLIDVHLQERLDGLECINQISLKHPTTKAIVYTAQDNPTFAARAMILGAKGFISKQEPAKTLLQMIAKLGLGEDLWTKDDRAKLSGVMRGGIDSSSDIYLTKREQEVLKQLTLGISNKEIAQKFGISYETVKEHVQHVLGKLGVDDRVQAAVWAIRKYELAA